MQALAVTPDYRTTEGTSQPFSLHGVVLRTTLLALLKHRLGLAPAPPPGTDLSALRSRLPASQLERLQMCEKLEQIPIKVRAPIPL